MLLPALSTAKERAKAIKCTSNLKQTLLASIQYLNDNRMIFMAWGTAKGGSTYTYSFLLADTGYLCGPKLSNTGITAHRATFCPSTWYQIEDGNNWFTYGTPQPRGNDTTQPSGNSNWGVPLYARISNASGQWAWNTSAIRQPSTFVLFADAIRPVSVYSNTEKGYATYNFMPSWNAGTAGFALRHRNTGGAGYLDGHAENITAYQWRLVGRQYNQWSSMLSEVYSKAGIKVP